jgi:hypothetical protein
MPELNMKNFMIIYFLSNLLVLYDLLTNRNARRLGYALEPYFFLSFTPSPKSPPGRNKKERKQL